MQRQSHQSVEVMSGWRYSLLLLSSVHHCLESLFRQRLRETTLTETMASAVSHKGGSDAPVRSQLRPDCHTQSSK